MNRARMLCGLLAGMAIVATTGCGQSAMKLPQWSPKKALPTIAPLSPAERRGAIDLQYAYEAYRMHLVALRDHYEANGQIDKRTWARRELDNLDDAQTFAWAAMPEKLPVARTTEPTEAGTVERVVTSRHRYIGALEALVAFYRGASLDDRARLAANMHKRLDPIRMYSYFLDAEVPPADLKCDQLINDADRLYAQAMKLHAVSRGVGPMHFGSDKEAQRRVLARLREIADRHPRSSRMPRVAWNIAEIYRTCFDENVRAAAWYQRAWQWDPSIQVPARFQAARLYDRKLQDPAQAIALYRAAMQHETFDAGNMKTAAQRIEKLRASVPDPSNRPDTIARRPEGKDVSAR